MVSLLAGSAIFAIKLWGWYITGSAAVLSDALESTVNVVAAAFAVFAIRYASKPADRDHPYGHGKIELLSAAFEGGLISFAAVMVFYTSGSALINGVDLRELDIGLGVMVIAGAANLILGSWLLKVGKETSSATLIADAKHILSDVWTTLGVLIGLGLVRLTGISWLDPLAGLMMGVILAWTGIKLVQESAHALLDREDPELLAKLVEAFNIAPVEGLTNVHRLRAIRSGDLIHVDAHVFVPAHWTVERAHEAITALEESFAEHAGFHGELALHLDPCSLALCTGCDVKVCPLRAAPFGERVPLTLEDAISNSGLERMRRREGRLG